MSLTMAAPASSAARATMAFVVSIEIGMVERFASYLITGRTLCSSSSADTVAAPPGRVDSPPTAMMSAPSAIICSAWASALAIEKNAPPSLKLSGVTLSTPITSVRSPMESWRPSAIGQLRTLGRVFGVSIQEEYLHLPLPLGERRGEGLTCHQTLPLIPLPNGEGKKTIRKKPDSLKSIAECCRCL